MELPIGLCRGSELRRRAKPWRWLKLGTLLALCTLILFVAGACGGSSPTPSPGSDTTLPDTSTPTNGPDTPLSATATPPLSPIATQPSTPNSLFVYAPTLELGVVGLSRGEPFISGKDVVEVTVGTPGFPVVGFTNLLAVVSVNGKLVFADEFGMFVAPLILVEGPNFVEVTASDLPGSERFILMVVHFIPSGSGVPLHVIWPPDEFDVDVGRLTVIGTSRPDAVISVNGVPVLLSVEDVFRHEISLQEGPNLIEVNASDLLGNTRTVQRVVTWVK